MNNISATIITLNEEKHLPSCLESIKDLCKEIIVVDSGSTDKTVEIAKKFGAKVFARKFDNYANQKNYASMKASGDWILSIDADEYLSPELKSEILTELADKATLSTHSAFSIPRKNIIFGKFIEYTRWQPELDRHIWLYKKSSGKWFGAVHEEVVVNGSIGKLKHPKVHHQYETISEFMIMLNKYSSFEAKERLGKGEKYDVLMLIFYPIYHFFVRYVYRLGFLDGWRGFVLSFLMAIYHIEVRVKLWELTK